MRHWAEHLGFHLGPQAFARGWEKALRKVRKKASLRSTLGLGLHCTSVAYSVYIAALLGFLLQLDLVPPE